MVLLSVDMELLYLLCAVKGLFLLGTDWSCVMYSLERPQIPSTTNLVLLNPT